MHAITIDPPVQRLENRLRLRSFAKRVTTIIVFLLIAATAWKLNDEHNLTGSLLSEAFFVGTLLAITYRFINPIGWVLTLRGLGHRVAVVPASVLWLHAESRRWLPGGVWGYASRAVGAKELGVPLTVASASMLVELLVTIGAALVVGIVGVILCWAQLSSTVTEIFGRSDLGRDEIARLTAAAITLVSCCYVGRAVILRKLQALTEKAIALKEIRFQADRLAGTFAYLILMAFVNGLVSVAMVSAVDSSVSVPVVAMIAATSLAWLVGFFAFFSPGGILVREATFAAILLPWLPYEVGFSVAMLSRFSQLIAELLGMAVILLKKKHPSGEITHC